MAVDLVLVTECCVFIGTVNSAGVAIPMPAVKNTSAVPIRPIIFGPVLVTRTSAPISVATLFTKRLDIVQDNNKCTHVNAWLIWFSFKARNEQTVSQPSGARPGGRANHLTVVFWAWVPYAISPVTID
jgi:hypothetical protein